MLKDVIYLLCIYSCIGSELLRAIFPFTLLDYSGLSILFNDLVHAWCDGWHIVSDSCCCFLVFFGIVFESDLKIGILLWSTKCWFVVNDYLIPEFGRRNSVSFSTSAKQSSWVLIFAWLCARTDFSTVSSRYVERCYLFTVHIFMYWQWIVKSYISIYFIRL